MRITRNSRAITKRVTRADDVICRSRSGQIRGEKRADGFSPPAHHTVVLANAARGRSRIAYPPGPGHGGLDWASRVGPWRRIGIGSFERSMIQSDYACDYSDLTRPVLLFDCSVSTGVAPFGATTP